MKYYRIAIQISDQTGWKWKSTPLASLEALFQLLRLYSPIPQDRLRVFMASSRQEMDVMLAQENNGVATNSITVQHFLSERRICSLGMRQEGSSSKAQEQQGRRVRTITLPSLAVQSAPAETLLHEKGLSALDKRRLELEMGASGDHDQPYTFALPVSALQLRAWTRLFVQVLSDELLP
jgi:hypothetical protein